MATKICLYALVFASVVFGQATSRQRIYGYCEQGGAKVTTAGIPSTTPVMSSAPGCTVTVTMTGSQLPATLYADNNGTVLSNPFQADALTGYWFFYADDAVYDVALTQNGVTNVLGAVQAFSTNFTQPFTTAALRTKQAKLQESVSVEDFTGADCGEQINNAYQAIATANPPTGVITLHHACIFSTPIRFNVPQATITLAGQGNATTMTYTGTGIALLMDNGLDFDFATAIESITLSGPGSGSATSGVQMGGVNGCVGCSLTHVKIENFGTGLQTNSNSWLTRVSQSMIRSNGINLLMPSGQVQAGENITFDHVVFADAPAPHTNSVWVQGGGQEVVFEDCSFDQAQVRIGNGLTSAAQVVIHGSHFENPNFAVGGVDYTYLTMDNHNGNYLRLTDDYMLQDRVTGLSYDRFMDLKGGLAVISGLGMFTPVHLNFLAVLANAVNISLFGFNDLSGNTGTLYGGSTTGYVASIPGANTASTSGFNNLMKVGDALGGAALDVTGNIRTDRQLVSIAPQGTAPIVVNSTTPISNLFGHILLYTPAGVQQTTQTHAVQASILALGGGSATVTLTGAAVFTNVSSYTCVAADTTAASAVRVTYTSGSQFTLSGVSGDNATYFCLGF